MPIFLVSEAEQGPLGLGEIGSANGGGGDRGPVEAELSSNG
jgi:hypothetical protein